MDSPTHPDDEHVRFSDSPRRWTQVIQNVQSPTKSVHPEHSGFTAQMESIQSQPDFGLRTTDFFEESSDDEGGPLPGSAITSQHYEPLDRSSSPSKRKHPPPSTQTMVSQCEPKRVSRPDEPGSEGYRRLDSNLNEQVPAPGTITPSISYHGSVDEMDILAPQEASPQQPKPARLSSTQRFRTSGLGWGGSGYQQLQDGTRTSFSNKAEQRLGVHAMAYDFLLQGMMRDEELMKENTRRPLNEMRDSLLPPQLRTAHDPRSPREPLPRDPSIGRTNTAGSKKKVQMIPPPIDTDRRSLPDDFVRTPYPFTHDKIHRKDFSREPPSATESPTGVTESVLTLSIRRSNANSIPRVTSITIPASNDFSIVRDSDQPTHNHSYNGRTNEKGFTSLVFDDQEFFRQLRAAYRDLSGPAARFFSARSLTRIAVSGPATRAADAGYGWLHQPRSPRVLAYKGLTDTFSEEKILQHYRRPSLGKSRYAFVHWAHRLAAAPPPQRSGTSSRRLTPNLNEGLDSPSSELVRRLEQPEGLEFVVSWSIRRILLALLLAILLAVAATLLWILLGKISSVGPAGFRDAGDRVASGVLIGVLVVLIGLAGVSGWVGVSWLVM